MNASHRTASQQVRWSLGDVFDFECEVGEAKKRSDEALECEGEVLHERMGNVPLEAIPRQNLLFAWLDLRRKESSGAAGTEIDRAFRFARTLMWITGVLLGGMSAGGYLHYFGKEPVSVFWLLFLLVLFPLLLSGLAVLLALSMQDHSGLGVIGGRIFGAISRLSGRRRQAWEAWNGMMKKHGKHLLPLAKWPLLGLTQRFACAFGIGALLALWVRVVFTDIAFGWQSTAGWTPEAWHAAAQFFSAPWTWAFPSGVPTLDQMRGSQFTYLGGMAALDPEATRAWWPFLMANIAVYSVALRGLFIALLGWNGRRAFARLHFDHSDANWLCRKFVGPPLSCGHAADIRRIARGTFSPGASAPGGNLVRIARGGREDGRLIPAGKNCACTWRTDLADRAGGN